MISLSLAIRIAAATVVSFALAVFVGTGTNSWDDAYLEALLRVREPVPVARELLLATANGAPQPDGHQEPRPVELIWALAELGAERVLLPPSWPAADTTGADSSHTAPELASRLDEEYALIDENIATFFEAIRIGSIDPKDADRFIEQLRRLVADSKARIRDDLRQKAGASDVSVEDLIGAFGSDRAGRKLSDLGVSLPSYPSALAVALPPRGDDGALDFRRLSYSSISRYISLTNRLDMRLSELEERGFFDETDPRERPSVMRDRIRSLRRELYEHPTEARAAVWRNAVDDYFETMAGLIDTDTQAPSSRFAAVREEYAAVVTLRNELSEAVGESFVILDDAAADEDTRASAEDVAVPAHRELTQGERRAVVANAALVGEHIVEPTGWKRALLLTAAGLIVGIILTPFRLPVAAALSPPALLLVAALFPALFLAGNIWVDPVAVVAVLLAAILASTIAAGLSQWSVERTVVGRATNRLPPRLLGRAIRRGDLPRTETGRRRTAVVVMAPTDSFEVDQATSFHRAISRKVRHLGGVVVGEEGSTVFAAFDADDARLAQRACAAAKEMVSATLPGGITVRCGVEVGELVFYLSPIGGYRATGRPITYARRLCGLARKHGLRAMFGDSVVGACRGGGEPRGFQEKGKLAAPTGRKPYAFYSLTKIDPPSL